MTPRHSNTGDPQANTACNYGSLGTLNTRPDSIQCHICGEWWTSLAAHADQTHGLTADEYRAAFGLMRKTKLVAPVLRKAQRQRTAEHLRQVGGPHHVRRRGGSGMLTFALIGFAYLVGFYGWFSTACVGC